MSRPVVVALLATALVLGGCATPRRPVLPPGTDADAVADAIARRGRGEGPPAPPLPPEPHVVPRRLKVWEKVLLTCALLAFHAALGLARFDTDDLDLSEPLHEIWSDDYANE